MTRSNRTVLAAVIIASLALVSGTARAEESRKPGRAEQLADECKSGRAASCVELGDLHLSGKGAPRSCHYAGNALRRACKLGDASGCRKMAELYLVGTYLIVAD